MKNNKGFTPIVLLIAIVAVLAIGGGAYYLGKSSSTIPLGTENNYQPVEQDENATVQTSTTSNTTQTQVIWKKSPRFGLWYQDTFNIIEYLVDQNGKETSSQVGFATFVATFGNNQDTVITWGGGNDSSCMEDGNEFGAFQYGVSSVYCLKGLRTWIAHSNARNSVTPEELKIFGDFVLKNK